MWKDWGVWEECTVTCGGGIQVRNRTCVGPYYNGDDCPGSANDTKICGTTLCPSKIISYSVMLTSFLQFRFNFHTLQSKYHTNR